eukprot:2832589-Amphidinium_carterae.1
MSDSTTSAMLLQQWMPLSIASILVACTSMLYGGVLSLPSSSSRCHKLISSPHMAWVLAFVMLATSCVPQMLQSITFCHLDTNFLSMIPFFKCRL